MTVKKTVGQYVLDGQQQESTSISAIKLQKQMEKEYLEELNWCVKHELKEVDCAGLKGHEECYKKEKTTEDFFVDVIIKREMFLANTIRTYFTARKTCPTPEFDQTVYRYNSATKELEFLWVIPDRESCDVYSNERDKVVPEEQDLLFNILAFKDGSLLKKAKKFNKEISGDGCALEKEIFTLSEDKNIIKEK